MKVVKREPAAGDTTTTEGKTHAHTNTHMHTHAHTNIHTLTSCEWFCVCFRDCPAEPEQLTSHCERGTG